MGVQWTHQHRGNQTKRTGAAMSTMWDALSQSAQFRCQCRCRRRLRRLCQPLLPTHTIALMVSPIGSWGGPWARRSGAAECTGRVAQDRQPVALLSPPAPPMIAMPVSLIGWRGGVRQRRIGAARTLARAAHQQLEVVLESLTRLDEQWIRGTLALAPSSGDALGVLPPMAGNRESDQG